MPRKRLIMWKICWNAMGNISLVHNHYSWSLSPSNSLPPPFLPSSLPPSFPSLSLLSWHILTTLTTYPSRSNRFAEQYVYIWYCKRDTDNSRSPTKIPYLGKWLLTIVIIIIHFLSTNHSSWHGVFKLKQFHALNCTLTFIVPAFLLLSQYVYIQLIYHINFDVYTKKN